MAIITTTNLKAWMGIEDQIDDPVLSSAVDAANAAVVEHCGRSFDMTATGSASARVFHARDPYQIVVDDFHETTALVVKTDEGDDGTYETTWTLNTDYIVEPTNGRENGLTVPYHRIVAVGSYAFPVGSRRPGVQVTAAWGWASVPAAVTQATLIKATRLFKRKDSPEGVLGGWSEYGAVRISNRDDPDVMALLAPFRRGVPIGIA